MKRANFPRRKEQRRQEAFERQDVYNNLSIKEKIELATFRRGKSEKELDRLSRQKNSME